MSIGMVDLNHYRAYCIVTLGSKVTEYQKLRSS
jgi:hypothetical protein